MRASGVVLAGGSSRRMGRDKAVLSVSGERLVDRAVRCLQQVAEDVVVASGRRQLRGLAVPQVADQRGGSGPLAGLAAGLVAVEHDIVFVLAVDMPHASATLFTALAEMWAGENALIPSAGGRPQPLHALWSPSAAVGLTLLMAEGIRSVREATDRLDARILDDVETQALVGDDRWAHNVNRPEDL